MDDHDYKSPPPKRTYKVNVRYNLVGRGKPMPYPRKITLSEVVESNRNESKRVYKERIRLAQEQFERDNEEENNGN